jgi:hypothetical protein
MPGNRRNLYGNVEKSRQRRSRPFAVLTYWAYAPRANKGRALRDAASNTAALLDELPASARTCFLTIPVAADIDFSKGMHVPWDSDIQQSLYTNRFRSSSVGTRQESDFPIH